MNSNKNGCKQKLNCIIANLKSHKKVLDNKSPAITKVHFANLDGLRFMCFFMVFMSHSFFSTDTTLLQSDFYKFMKLDVVRNGIMGVNFFFVLSGFLITFLLIREKQNYGKINIPHFWLRRILRIWPLYFGCVIFGFIIFPFIKLKLGQTPNETASPFYYISFLSNFDIINKGLPDCSVLGILWSVAIEEQFYLTWPIILAIIPVKKYWIPFAFIIAGSLVFRFYNDTYDMHEYHTISCISDMAIGGLAAWLTRFEAFLLRIKNISKLTLIVLYSTFIIAFFFRDEVQFNFFYGRLFERLFISIIAALIILEQCYCENSLFKFSRSKYLTRLGVISYGLYCLHFIGILIAINIFKIIMPVQNYLQVFVLVPLFSLALTICIAYLSYRFFESPFLKLKKRLEK